MFITQISVYLENNQGTLRSLTKMLADNQIDMLALSVADTAHFGIVRIVVRESDVDKTLTVLRVNGFMAKKNHVLCAAVRNEPAGLHRVLAVIEENDISIEYMYSFNYNIEGNALIILRLSSSGMERAQIAELLSAKGIHFVSQDAVNAL